jgi:hypothetical protein
MFPAIAHILSISKMKVAMLFVMLRLMVGFKNNWIIFYLSWSHWAIFGVEVLWGISCMI